MGFLRQEYWSDLPCAPPGDHPDPGIEPESPAWQVDSFTTELSNAYNPKNFPCNTGCPPPAMGDPLLFYVLFPSFHTSPGDLIVLEKCRTTLERNVIMRF